jgi:hypothetical protein
MKPVIAFNDHHFELGQKVSFIRQLPDGTIGSGTATFMAVHLDQNKRVMAHLKADEKLETGQDNFFNTDLMCIDCSDEFKEEYARMTAQVRVLTDEGGKVIVAKSEEISKEYNSQIEDCYTALLGEPVEI